jgi:uncharacterized membrane protein YeaQ/YmgE (transglycosylase-associated protein family)
MTVAELLILAVLACILGLVTQTIFGLKAGGWFVSTLLGFAGGWFGNWVAGQLAWKRVVYLGVDGVGEYGVIWAILGTLLATLTFNFIAKYGGRHRDEKKK